MPRRIRDATPLLALLLMGIGIVAALGFLNGRDLVARHWSADARDGGSVVTLPSFVLVPQVWTCVHPCSTPDTTGGPYAQFRYDLRIGVPDGAVASGTGPAASTVVAGGLFRSRHSLGWILWTSLPSTMVALGLLGLLVAALVIALRRGASGRTLRLLRVAGLGALIAGPAAALLETLSSLWASGPSFTPSAGRWETSLIWVLIGGALLAVRAVLARVDALRTELEGVI